jgi:hypothetical protein
MAWQPHQCLKFELYPFNWTYWGTHPERPNQIFLGPITAYVARRTFPWEEKGQFVNQSTHTT